MDSKSSPDIERALTLIALAIQSGKNDSVKTYVNAGTGGGTGYYFTINGIKVACGVSGAFSSAVGQGVSCGFPTGFFNSILYSNLTLFNPSSTNLQAALAFNSSAITGLGAFLGGIAGTTTALNWIAIGI